MASLAGWSTPLGGMAARVGLCPVSQRRRAHGSGIACSAPGAAEALPFALASDSCSNQVPMLGLWATYAHWRPGQQKSRDLAREALQIRAIRARHSGTGFTSKRLLETPPKCTSHTKLSPTTRPAPPASPVATARSSGSREPSERAGSWSSASWVWAGPGRCSTNIQAACAASRPSESSFWPPAPVI